MEIKRVSEKTCVWQNKQLPANAPTKRDAPSRAFDFVQDPNDKSWNTWYFPFEKGVWQLSWERHPSPKNEPESSWPVATRICERFIHSVPSAVSNILLQKKTYQSNSVASSSNRGREHDGVIVIMMDETTWWCLLLLLLLLSVPEVVQMAKIFGPFFASLVFAFDQSDSVLYPHPSWVKYGKENDPNLARTFCFTYVYQNFNGPSNIMLVKRLCTVRRCSPCDSEFAHFPASATAAVD